MGDIAVREGSAIEAPADPLVQSARAYAEASRAARTKDAYRRAWGAFVRWCEGRGERALPAEPATVALYLAGRADAGRKPATLDLDLAAIGEAHRAGGHPSPRGAAEVQAVLKGVRRTKGVAQRQAAPLLAADMVQICRALEAEGDGVRRARDRALLLVGWAGAMRRSELVGLRVGDVRFCEAGMELTIRRSKTDQEGKGEVKAVPFAGDPAACPVRALRAWLMALEVMGLAGPGADPDAPIFREVTRHSAVGAGALTGRSVARIVKRACEAAGLDPARYSGHSLRAGLATSAAKAGKSDRAIMRQTGHRSVAMVRKYVRDAERWADNAAAGLL